MALFFVRHGHVRSDDPDKKLSAEGLAQVEHLAQWLLANDFRPREIVHSDTRRTAETARILGEAFDPPLTVRSVGGIGPDDAVSRSHAMLVDDDTMIVSHQPFIAAATMLLAGREVPLGPSAIVVLEEERGRWEVRATFSP
jgi:phosphohistidine phosphatase